MLIFETYFKISLLHRKYKNCNLHSNMSRKKKQKKRLNIIQKIIVQ